MMVMLVFMLDIYGIYSQDFSTLAIKPSAFDDIPLRSCFKNKTSISIKSQAHRISSKEMCNYTICYTPLNLYQQVDRARDLIPVV